MPDQLIPCNSQTIIEIRPFRGGWQCYEGPGVAAYGLARTQKRCNRSTPTTRARFGRGEIRVLNVDGSIKDVIRSSGSTRNYD